MSQDKIDMKRPLSGNATLPSTGRHSREHWRASSPWHRSSVERTNDEQRGSSLSFEVLCLRVYGKQSTEVAESP